MENKTLSPAQLAEYKFLKQQVDNMINETNRRDALPGSDQKLAYAREDLRAFVAARRKEGVNI